MKAQNDEEAENVKDYYFKYVKNVEGQCLMPEHLISQNLK